MLIGQFAFGPRIVEKKTVPMRQTVLEQVPESAQLERIVREQQLLLKSLQKEQGISDAQSSGYFAKGSQEHLKSGEQVQEAVKIEGSQVDAKNPAQEDAKQGDALVAMSQHKNEHKNEEDLKDSSPIYTHRILPMSSAWCYGDKRQNRVCKFRNLCYHAEHDQWFILKTNRSVQHNVPLKNRYRESLLELGSVTNHSVFYWNYVEASPFEPSLQNVQVRYEEETYFIFRRLHPRNIMHNLHDDVLTMYHLMKEYAGGGSYKHSQPFSLDHRLMIIDDYLATDSTRPFQYLSNKPLRFKRYLKQKGHENVLTCFREAIVGQSKLTTWYQYGFKDPQGPLSAYGKETNGLHVREVAEWLIGRLGLPLGDDERYEPIKIHQPLPPAKPDNSQYDFPETNLIVIMSRRQNRLILNEDDLAKKLEAHFHMKTVFLRNEDMSFEEQIKMLRKARVVIGMHGSILVMAIFCRRGTVLVEMYPFAVPGDHYTPYRTMSELPGMNLVYRAWENKHEDATVAHPDRSMLMGGLKHLPKEEQEKVKTTLTVPQHKCCTSPYWLYRIYQDTIVNIPEMIDTITDGLQDSRSRLKEYREKQWEDANLMIPVWDMPWTGIRVEQFKVVIQGSGKEYVTMGNATSVAIKDFPSNSTVKFFVAIKSNGIWGEWGSMGECPV
ncbi:hypothetical protein EDD86DRAFT_246076 [Gorgonomyces haynaldii]|nr:hypothetical protein EDD86DRAFT_246076 [Gorgonomyces haynaldii]